MKANPSSVLQFISISSYTTMKICSGQSVISFITIVKTFKKQNIFFCFSPLLDSAERTGWSTVNHILYLQASASMHSKSLRSGISGIILYVLIFTDKSFIFGVLDKLFNKKTLSSMSLSSKSSDTNNMAKRTVFNPNIFGSTYFRKSQQNAIHKNKHLKPPFHQVKLFSK